MVCSLYSCHPWLYAFPNAPWCWNIYLHLPSKWPKYRQIYHTWSIWVYAFLQCVPDPDGQGDVLPGEGFAETHSGCQQRWPSPARHFPMSRRTVPGEAETNRFLIINCSLRSGCRMVWTKYGFGQKMTIDDNSIGSFPEIALEQDAYMVVAGWFWCCSLLWFLVMERLCLGQSM